MALLTFGTAPQKGSSSSVTLDKAELLAIPEIAADSYWASGATIKNVIVLFGSTTGGQERSLVFDYSQTTPTASLTLSARARDAFQISRIILMDFDNGAAVFDRADIIGSTPSIADFDISLSAAPTGTYTDIMQQGFYGPNANIGRSAVISADGTTIVVGIPYGSALAGGPSGEWGRIAVLKKNLGSSNISAGGWYVHIITSGIQVEDDYLGFSVAVSADGSLIAVGAPGAGSATAGGNTVTGQIHVFRLSGYFGASYGLWSESIIDGSTFASDLPSLPSGNSYSLFGWRVAMSGDGRRIVSSVSSNSSTGLAVVFTYTDRDQYSAEILSPSDGAVGDKFGESLAISGDGRTIAVGSPEHSYTDANTSLAVTYGGAVYTFKKDIVNYITAQSWLETKIIPTYPSHVGYRRNDSRFGGSYVFTRYNVLSLSHDGCRLVVGNPDGNVTTGFHEGLAYVYTWGQNNWEAGGSPAWTEATLPQTLNGGPSEGDRYGETASISGDGRTITLGIVNETTSNQNAVWQFLRSGSAWSESYIPPSVTNFDRFGEVNSLTFTGSDMLVASPRASTLAGVPFHARVGLRTTSAPQTEQVLANTVGSSSFMGRKTAVSDDGSTIVSTSNAVVRVSKKNPFTGQYEWFCDLVGDYLLGASARIIQGVAISANGNRIFLGTTSFNLLGYAANYSTHPSAVLVFDYDGTGYTQTSVVTASDGTVDDIFGREISCSADGFRFVVSAHRKAITTGGGLTGAGAVYVYTQLANSWSEEIIRPGLSDGDLNFGKKLAMSRDGSSFVVTTTRTAAYQGGIYWYKKYQGETSWTREDINGNNIVPYAAPYGFIENDPDATNVVAISHCGRLVVVGGMGGNVGAPVGYVFRRSSIGEWSVTYLAMDPQVLSQYFYQNVTSCAISNDGRTVVFGCGSMTTLNHVALYTDASTDIALAPWATPPTATRVEVSGTVTDIGVGDSVALSGNGQILVVGDTRYQPQVGALAGALRIFKRY